MGTENLVLPSVCLCMSVFILINSVTLAMFPGHDAFWQGVVSIHTMTFRRLQTKVVLTGKSSCLGPCELLGHAKSYLGECQGPLHNLAVQLIMFQCTSTVYCTHTDTGYKVQFLNDFKYSNSIHKMSGKIAINNIY